MPRCGSESHCRTQGERLLVGDVQPWVLRTYGDYARKEDKLQARIKNPTTMAAVLKAIKQQNNLVSAVYGQEHLEVRMGAMKSMGDLHGAYEELFIPTFLMHVWGEMTFEYYVIVEESIRRTLQALPKYARRERLKERSFPPSMTAPNSGDSRLRFRWRVVWASGNPEYYPSWGDEWRGTCSISPYRRIWAENARHVYRMRTRE